MRRRQLHEIGRSRHKLSCEMLEARRCLATIAFPTEYLISDEQLEPRSVHAADLDNDGDMDVLAASREDGKIVWYDNDGRGTFGSQQIITDQAPAAQAVTAADLDNDGDLDVLSASVGGDMIAWYENTDGQGTFGPKQIISDQCGVAWFVDAADLNGDGDMDVLSACPVLLAGKIAWHENVDGQGTFGTEQIVEGHTFEAPVTVQAVDVNGDKDLDILVANLHGDRIAWHDNVDGLGTFGPVNPISLAAPRATSVRGVDVDGDGDVDVLSASQADNKIAWYENTDGDGTFGEQQVITSQAFEAVAVHGADLDGDGDMDAISASQADNKIAWYENVDGHGQFGDQLVVSSRAMKAQSVTTADVDLDGDLDLISASADDNRIVWYENRLIGDVNNDGRFNSSDLVAVFEAGKYEADTPNSATYDEGDWDLDGRFTTSDLVLAFQAGHYIHTD